MEIIHESRDFAVICKPVGLDSEIQVPEAVAAALGGQCFPIHRLDKNVGGLMVYARSRAAAAQLSRAVQEGRLTKCYYAAVHGSLPESGAWEDLLWKDTAKNKVFVVKRQRKGVKQARLSFRKLDEREGLSLARIQLDTGRSHQIRVQFASRQYPLAGDRKYGGRDDFEAPLLFSCGLSFPFGGKTYTFEAAPDWVKEGRFLQINR